MEPIRAVGVVGAGQMGSGIAQVFAQRGYDVTMVDVDEAAVARGLKAIGSSVDRLIKKGAIAADEREALLGRITTATEIESLAETDLVVEAATERRDLKFDLFRRLDALCPPETILASNTSSISITEIAAQTRRPEKVIGMHFFNPVVLMALVEIVRGQLTEDATYATVEHLARDLGKTPVAVNDYPGFVSNRILMPMINEAIFCVMEGVAEPEAIDTVMKLGMNHPMGPLALADFIGLDTCLAIMEVLHQGLGDDKYRPCPLLRRMVAAGLLGKKSGRGFYQY
ncbi:MAG TPA: 3-hydroxybutyryl-CoA dehydrogenase [Herpetosiphonaceae bacterium]|nr:3-hydroxybutyryl-CoA dehydrogenase [Herpetosiphonaceae bacterium]